MSNFEECKIVRWFYIRNLEFNVWKNLIFKSVSNWILDYDKLVKEMLDSLNSILRRWVIHIGLNASVNQFLTIY